jgi:hypothetical protein
MVELKTTRENIINKAEELAIKYEAMYKGCAQTTFLTVVDALRWGGLELIPVPVEDKLYPGISMLSAGVCMTAEGTCGAMVGGTMAIGLAIGGSRDSTDVSATRNAAAMIRNTLLEKCYLDYRSILCKDIQRKYFGKAWDLADDKMAHEFLSITRGCIIMQAAKLTVGYILDEYEKGNVRVHS